MTTYGYARVSTASQANDGESLDVQDRMLRGWCLMQGVEMGAMFVDPGVSGSTPLAEREQGAEMLRTLKRGDVVVASKLDRMFRSALDALQVVETLRRRGVDLVLLDLGGAVTGNGLSKLFLTVAAAFAEAERDRIRERVSQAKADQRARGRYLGGRVPLGYRRDGEVLIEVPEEMAVVARAKELRAAGGSFRAVQRAVADETGRTLSLDALHRITR